MDKSKTVHRCINSYCRGSILKHDKGILWKCQQCGHTYPIKVTLDNFGLITANQIHKVEKKESIIIDDLTDSQIKRAIEIWKKKNMSPQ